ncbi:MAG: TIGR03936 family radical SAM-associated protein [Clostridiales bacterium]|nr:TIGR03936 family radical SAM-associated protein [Clostridiales bacterium]
MRCVRVWFSKTGQAKYISHLDLMRCMSRLMRRAHIPLWYTEGFNPHPYMMFALPLSLGSESNCESMDIRIEGDITDDEIFKRLNDNMPIGLEVLKISEPKMKTNAITYGEYELTFETQQSEKLKQEIEKMLSADELIVSKMGKQGRKKVEKQVNLIEKIKEYSLDEKDGYVILNVVLPAGNTVNINPSLLSGAIEEKSFIGGECCRTFRKRLLTEDMKEFE